MRLSTVRRREGKGGTQCCTDIHLQSPHASLPQSPEPLSQSLPKVGFEPGILVMKHLLMSWDTALETVERRTCETNEMLASL